MAFCYYQSACSLMVHRNCNTGILNLAESALYYVYSMSFNRKPRSIHRVSREDRLANTCIIIFAYTIYIYKTYKIKTSETCISILLDASLHGVVFHPIISKLVKSAAHKKREREKENII